MKKFAKFYIALTVAEAALFGWAIYKASTAEARPWAAKGKSMPTTKK